MAAAVTLREFVGWAKSDVNFADFARVKTVQVEVFSYDENQLMHCSFVDEASGKKTEVDLSMNGKSDTDDNTIQKFVVE